MTITPFTPSPIAAFTFQPVLDGIAYNCSVTWNLWRRDWYINLTDQNGNLIVCKALVATAAASVIASAIWANGIVTVTTATPHGCAFGNVVDLTVADMAPDAYNGAVAANITGASTFTYPLAADPGPVTAFGDVSFLVDLVWGLADSVGVPFTSTMIFREGTNNFEVNP